MVQKERNKAGSTGESTDKLLSDILMEIPSVKIVPPGLRLAVNKFVDHCRLAQRKKIPVMIFGPSGVGKSLFIDIYSGLFLRDNPGKKVFTVNCSHFDVNLARSELFGHERGAFTDAKEEYDGWLAKANGGVLVLEEIGELPLEVQAQLLTFIETGEFYKIKSTRIEKSDVLIVGATNNELSLRSDFTYRFFPFNIPPLYKRREDVLYYLSVKFPDILPVLSPVEILALMAYNWPGNVRELERVGNLLLLRHLYKNTDPASVYRQSILEKTEEYESDLMIENAYSIFDYMMISRKSADHLEKYLNKGLVGISRYNDTHPLGKVNTNTLKAKAIQYGDKTIAESVPVEEFETAFKSGLIRFCSLFHQDPREDKNILQIHQGKPVISVEDIGLQKLYEAARSDHKYKRLEKIIFYHSYGIKVPSDMTIPSDTLEWRSFMSEMEELFPESSLFRRSIQKEFSELPASEPDVWSMKITDLIREYYSRLLKKAGGNIAEAARMAGMRDPTFRSSLKRYGVIK